MKEHLASYPYEKPSLDYMQTHIEFAAEAQQSNACTLHEAWAKVPAALNATEIQQYQEQIRELLKQHNAVMVAHYYVEP